MKKTTQPKFSYSFSISSISIRFFLIFFFLFQLPTITYSQDQSIARYWMNALLEAIRWEEGTPTIHARNMFHVSAAMYDVWTVYDKEAQPYFLGNTIGGFTCCSIDDSFSVPDMDLDSARHEAISFAAYRIIHYRMNFFASKARIIGTLDSTFAALGYNSNIISTDYMSGSPAALGNYIAECVINYGMQDGAREDDNYESYFYEPVNPPLRPYLPGNPSIKDPNRWQPISVIDYVKKKGLNPNLFDWHYFSVLNQSVFLNPEWGEVQPFSLLPEDRHDYNKDGLEYKVYLDPGSPPLLDYDKDSLSSEYYKWGFLLVALWSSHLDPADSVKWDISPGARGNYMSLPDSYAEYESFYDLMGGGIHSKGHKRNPYTGNPYESNMVLRGDYARVIAEFWVDGVNTATPPGHWFKTLNYVSDHPLLEKKWQGKGKILDPLAWDVKAYFTMGGAMHDAAIAAWGAKGYYDYVRPISAIRLMADRGQCTNPKLPHYHKEGLPLIKGLIELVGKKDPLAGKNKEHVDKVKIFCWKGPDYVSDPFTETAGVGWILAENWWPYQLYSFTTPPFAGYVSGHSTFSIAGAEVLSLITGDPFFPGGIAEFIAKENEFLLFEDGPSKDLRLQWATYKDASYETCLSRIWGGIHPPADDIPGRKMGGIIGKQAFQFANDYFRGKRK